MMPAAKLGFMLKPSGFFDTSPCLDLPPAKCDPCCETEDGYVPMRRSKRMRRTIRYENLKAEEEQRLKDSKKS